ncbi:dehydrogenase [Kaistia algarum]|uniref:PQQ-dependent sugar dehydrogenase n=1 Tax=Kaistia algarum TaxID=2083279 RepID=UPI000CE8C493|nr:PQQ-dependent sugar dehydrogenase [Kaistia algarum]MCX5512871.1 PQQ-dependent sugar dehydrogenase [Kaistia algarum]PPE81636.1 dehydrogenase [Kaistia algarum]
MAIGVFAALALTVGSARAIPPSESVNAGAIQPNTNKPFATASVATFEQPWAIAFLSDGRMLITERGGRLFLVSQSGQRQEVGGVPSVAAGIQNGLLDVAVDGRHDSPPTVFLTFSEPQRGLALARARLLETAAGAPSLDGLEVIWRQSTDRNGSFWGGVVALAPDGEHIFLAVRDSSRLSTDPSGAQDPDRDLGKVLRLNLDGSTPRDNPFSAAGGRRGQVWTVGHRTAYGLAFAPDGRLWEHEMGPEGGDEFNLLEAGGNYGWPLVSNGNDYGGPPIARHETRPDFKAPAIYWTPIIAPAGLTFYAGDMFPDWRGAALITGLRGEALARIVVDAEGRARQLDRWAMGARIRDVAVAPDGAVWVVEDGSGGRLLRLSRPD